MEPIEYPIDGILDLHVFDPRDVKDLVPEYLETCRARGILQIRIIHGKGTGTLRGIVHRILDKIPWVIGYRPADEGSGGWGATLVDLKER